jgi:hypothetical protein
LQLYVRQTHAEADLAVLGRLAGAPGHRGRPLLRPPTACGDEPTGAKAGHDAR